MQLSCLNKNIKSACIVIDATIVNELYVVIKLIQTQFKAAPQTFQNWIYIMSALIPSHKILFRCAINLKIVWLTNTSYVQVHTAIVPIFIEIDCDFCYFTSLLRLNAPVVT